MSGIPNLLEGLFRKKSIKTKLIEIGVDKLFLSSRYERPSKEMISLRKGLILHTSLLEEYDSAFSSVDHLSEFFKTAKEFGVDLYFIPFWKKKINESVSKKIIEEHSYSIWADRKNEVFSAAAMIPGFDWMPLFSAIATHQASCNYVRPSYIKAVDGLIETSVDKFKEYAESEVFYSKGKRPGYAVRGALYDKYVSQGFLTKKTARKMRSDGAEDASLSGLKALVRDKDLYSNVDELLLQFTDSKYEGVICYLADHLPEYLLTSIMGTEFYWGKRKLEDRLRRIEEEREANRESSLKPFSEV